MNLESTNEENLIPDKTITNYRTCEPTGKIQNTRENSRLIPCTFTPTANLHLQLSHLAKKDNLLIQEV